MRDQQPLPALIFENVRDEGVETYGFTVLAQKFDPFHANRPCCLSVDADMRLVCGNRDPVELAKAHLPSFAYAVPTNHDRGAQRADE